MQQRHRIVILGGGFGGLVTARQLLKMVNQDEVEIVLVDQSSNHLYTPWLYEVATGFLLEKGKRRFAALKKTAGVSLKLFKEQFSASTLRLRQAQVTAIEPTEKHVILAGGKTLKYDDLVIALGSEINDYNIPGIGEFAFNLKTLAATSRLQTRLAVLLEELRRGQKDRLKIVIAGAGSTGVEVAGELVNFLNSCDRVGFCNRSKIEVTLVDAGPTILTGSNQTVRKLARRRLEKLGVAIHLKTSCTKLAAEQVVVKPPSGEEFKMPCDMLIWAGGIKPNHVVFNSPLEKTERGRILVDEELRSRTFEHIYSLGDAAALISPHTGKALPSLAQVAIRQARVVARNIVASADDKPLVKYKIPKFYPTVIPVGGKYAILQAGSLTLGGRIPYYLHRLIDLKYFLQILPPWTALQAWRNAVAMYELND